MERLNKHRINAFLEAMKYIWFSCGNSSILNIVQPEKVSIMWWA